MKLNYIIILLFLQFISTSCLSQNLSKNPINIIIRTKQWRVERKKVFNNSEKQYTFKDYNKERPNLHVEKFKNAPIDCTWSRFTGYNIRPSDYYIIINYPGDDDFPRLYKYESFIDSNTLKFIRCYDIPRPNDKKNKTNGNDDDDSEILILTKQR